jgi:hypothetical protein
VSKRVVTTPVRGRAVTQTLPGTGTPFGYSYWISWMGCAQAALRRSQAQRGGGLSGNIYMDVGTITHALLDRFYRIGDSVDTSVIRWVDPSDQPRSYFELVLKKADHAFRGYRRHPSHRPDEFGAIVESEKMHEVKDWHNLRRFTWRPDLVVDISRAKAKALGVAPGLWVVDHKALASPMDNTVAWVQREPRFPAYVASHATVEKRVKGVIVNCIYYGSKEVRTERIPYVIKPGDLERMDNLFEEAARRERQAFHGEQEAPYNVTLCVTRRESCKWLGSCKGY